MSALAAALAVISGCTEVKQRSLLSGREVYLLKNKTKIGNENFSCFRAIQHLNCTKLMTLLEVCR